MKVGARTIFVEKINRDRHSFEKIMIFEQLEKGGNMTILAPRGNITKIGDRLNLRLFDGQRQLIENMAEPDNVQMMNFKVIDVPVGNAVAPFRPRGDDEQELLLPEIMAQNKPLADAGMQDISTSMNKRLVIALSCLFLPMLGVVLGVQSPRKRNLYQSVFALLLIIIYHQMVEFAGDFGTRLELGPAAMLWSVYALFFIISVVLFYKTTTGVGPLQDRVEPTLRGWGLNLDPFAWLRGRPQTP
ncbi:MAG: LptF/LptG family permease [Alphaproteobacteria bacterium]|nr:LptF/LptG family permease [Alphaproteobacteria bacterium]